jgi:regulator of sigma D
MGMRILAAVVLALPLVAAAQNAGELWEITSQMNIPGMPAGMGGQTQRVCQGDDPERRAASDKDQKDCKVTDKKQTANRLTVTMTCKQGTMIIDQQYNAARTEFKGSMKMNSKEGDITINTTGRKVGACNVQQAAKERDEKMAEINKQVAAAQAQGAAATKQYADSQIKQCATALDNMQWSGFGVYSQCYKKTDANCKTSMDASNQMSPEIAKSCNARVAEFCKRYQTQEGFLKAKANENAAQMCGVTTASVKAAQCPKAAQSESLAFLGAYCPVEAKPIAQQHCAGRDYTSKMGGKYARFCEAYLANADFEKPQQSQAQKATDQVKQGVSKGIDKLKGFFGR